MYYIISYLLLLALLDILSESHKPNTIASSIIPKKPQCIIHSTIIHNISTMKNISLLFIIILYYIIYIIYYMSGLYLKDSNVVYIVVLI